ncbi:aminoglycoside phosphotransferase family protein [Paenibacillus montanisoli]|uniref:Aminoglycoside phosphotransferase domain-containing protein n=1 Tax=Paenibacillus montanisoli TaxID=2081970 RepID=A0A328U8Y1_9BACL|nr:aminoglycoside phosphotransferase family protein [Paenibacillus montanisoli]RAP77781.1 hypothetical protein DL346_04810 [Paenibacillus montanisoli]
MKEMNVNGIILDLIDKGCLHPASKLKDQMNGTTEGRVYLITVDDVPCYVLKAEDPQYLAEVGQFHGLYAESPLLPKLHYLAPDRSFIIYEFVAGTIGDARGTKKEWMKKLTVDLLNHYRTFERPDSSEAWSGMILDGLHYAKNEIGDRLAESDYELVKSFALERLSSGRGRSVLLHGDCGVHNFVFDKGALKGVIDPQPMTGPMLYDFIFAFVSSPDDLNLETLLPAFELLQHEPLEQAELVREVMIRLYHRIAVCLLHHPHDLPAYLQAWPYWKALV